MSLRSLHSYNSFASIVTEVAELPNTNGATRQTAYLQIGDYAYVDGSVDIVERGEYVCVDATPNAAVWDRVAPQATRAIRGLAADPNAALRSVLNGAAAADYPGAASFALAVLWRPLGQATIAGTYFFGKQPFTPAGYAFWWDAAFYYFEVCDGAGANQLITSGAGEQPLPGLLNMTVCTWGPNGGGANVSTIWNNGKILTRAGAAGVAGYTAAGTQVVVIGADNVGGINGGVDQMELFSWAYTETLPTDAEVYESWLQTQHNGMLTLTSTDWTVFDAPFDTTIPSPYPRRVGSTNRPDLVVVDTPGNLLTTNRRLGLVYQGN